MRFLIDLQPLQTGSAERGIGRYSTALTSALLPELGQHEVFLLLNDRPINAHAVPAFRRLRDTVGEGHVLRYPLADLATPALFPKNDQVRLSKIMRERCIEAAHPDVVCVTSVFEFDALSTIPKAADRSYFCAAILYDLIPLADPANYLPNPLLKEWYSDRLKQLHEADAVLAISEHVRQDAMARLGLPAGLITNIAAATNLTASDRHHDSGDEAVDGRATHTPYILYVGGFDKRKNTEALIATFARMPPEVRDGFRLVLAGGITDARRQELEQYAGSRGLRGRVIFRGYVEDGLLVSLYKNAHLFVFPSTDEGFGLPPLEAMSLGVPTIASHHASLPEVVGNPDALFDPHDQEAFGARMLLALQSQTYRDALVHRGLEQASRFTWAATARRASSFIEERRVSFSPGTAARYSSFRDFLRRTDADHGIPLRGAGDAKTTNLLARALLHASDNEDAQNAIHTPPEFRVSEAFSHSVPDFCGISSPCVFSSVLCREQHFRLPLYTYWCTALGEKPRFHRKQWEFVYICQALHERGYLRGGVSAVGFGVGREPLASCFASRGVDVLATDLDPTKAEQLGWASSNQHCDHLNALNERGLCDEQTFRSRVRFRHVDMNDIPEDLGAHDICWSSCALEHLGSIRKGLDFVKNSARLLKPGGIAVHTTEYNISSNAKTLDNNPGLVIFRRRDIETLVSELQAEGFQVEPVDFSAGEDELERYVDLPPYMDEPHLRLQLAGEYVTTSLGIIVRVPMEARQ